MVNASVTCDVKSTDKGVLTASNRKDTTVPDIGSQHTLGVNPIPVLPRVLSTPVSQGVFLKPKRVLTKQKTPKTQGVQIPDNPPCLKRKRGLTQVKPRKKNFLLFQIESDDEEEGVITSVTQIATQSEPVILPVKNEGLHAVITKVSTVEKKDPLQCDVKLGSSLHERMEKFIRKKAYLHCDGSSVEELLLWMGAKELNQE